MACGYAFLKWFLDHLVVKVFFRRIDVVGLYRIPDDGPVIFVANHNNQFVDPMMLITNIRRVVRFLIASKSLKRPLVGPLARMAQSIGVERSQDLARKGKGIISCDEGGSKVRGEDTVFTKELTLGAKIKVGDIEMAVKVVDSDTECTVDSCPVSLTKAAFKIMPRVDQTAVYAEVHKALRNGDCIGIFPEGGSHDRPNLLQLKPGVAIMALGAMKAGAGAVKIVPCGLHYFDPYRFRSRVIVEFGDPFEVPQTLVQKYNEDKRGAVAELMKLVDDAMKGVVPEAQDYEEMQALLTMRALIKPRGKKLSPEETLQLNKMFAMARHHMGSDKRFQDLVAEVEEYTALLRSGGLRDRDVRLGLSDRGSVVLRTLSAIVHLVCLAPLTIPTVILSLPVMTLTTCLAKREKKQALASSTVKVRGLDVVASYKILTSFVICPLYSLVLSGAVTRRLGLGVAGFGATYTVGIPVFFGLGIRACDHSVRCWHRCRATFLFCGGWTAGLFKKVLMDRRQSLQEKVKQFVEDSRLQVTEAQVQAEKEDQLQVINTGIQELVREGVVKEAVGH